MAPDITRVRNIGIAGSHHAGKTTLTEAILAHCGAIARKGSAIDGTTTTDFEPECINHAQSTTVGFAHASCGSGGDAIDLTIVDAPGFIDFFEETKVALSGCDAAVVVLDADPSRVYQTRALVDFIESRKMPHLFIVNKMDRPGADFAGTLEALQTCYGRRVVAEQWPIGAAETFKGFEAGRDPRRAAAAGRRRSRAAARSDGRLRRPSHGRAARRARAPGRRGP